MNISRPNQFEGLSVPLPKENSPTVVKFPKAGNNKGAGIFTWILATDMVHCDASAAKSFGFELNEVKNGLAIAHFLNRMHKDDVAHVAKAIHDAIVTGEPYNEDYRIIRPDGSTIEVTALGSCFRSDDGEPSHYAGMIIPKMQSGTGDDILMQLCLLAYDVAKRSGRTETSEKLIEALATIYPLANEQAKGKSLRFRQ
jgi:hypothetical protein